MAGRLSAKIYRLGQGQVGYAVQDHHGYRSWRGKHHGIYDYEKIKIFTWYNSAWVCGEKILAKNNVNAIKKNIFVILHIIIYLHILILGIYSNICKY